MNKVIITIKTGNAAFVDSPPGHEIARILRRMADEFELSGSALNPYDINGNAVGTITITESDNTQNEQYEECSRRLERTLMALYEIAELGANPLTKYRCKTRADLMRHIDRMWIEALNTIKDDLEIVQNSMRG